MLKKYNGLLFILMVILLPNLKVDAATKQFNLCFGDDGLYSITYDDNKNSAVTKEQITLETAINGHLNYPNNVEDVRYNFTAVKIGSKCYTSGNTIKSCPEDSSTFDKIKKTYIVYGNNTVGVSDKINIAFNQNNGKFNITIKDQFNNKYDVRYVENANDYNEFNSASSYAGSFLQRDGSGNYHIYNVEPDHNVALEYYEKTNDPCNGSFIGRIIFYTPSLNDVTLDNPAVSNPGAYGCDQVKSYNPGIKTSSDRIALDTLKKNMVPLCYQKKITYGAYLQLGQTISSDFNSLKSLFSGYNVTQASGGNSCTDTYHGATALGYSSSGSYWAMSCVENFSSNGDTPKLVAAGGGFTYGADFTISRTCTLVQHTYPVMRPKCHTSCSCDCSWYNERTGYGETGVDSAGPNNAFDKCVNECDGGKYTQSCVNSCYSKSYKKNRDTSFIEKFSMESKNNSNIKFTAFTGDISAKDAAASGLVSSVPGYTSRGNKGLVYSANGDGASCTCAESNWCASGHGSCTFHFSVGPSGCVDDPVGLYNQELALAAAEKAQFEQIARSPIEIGDYTMTITDTYLNNGNFKLVLSSNTDPALQISSTQSPSGTGAIATVHVDLPLSYVNKITGEATYRSNDSAQPYSVNSKVGRLEAVNNFSSDNYYFTKGERKYYTSVQSPNFNVGFNNGQPVLSLQKYNIQVDATNVGWSHFSSTNQCYYGVYNKFYTEKTNDTCNPLTEICDGGIQYIFRPIVLSDVFPNGRDPRYNWNSASKNRGNDIYKTIVDPVEYTKTIQSKQDNIYNQNNGEIDYEFILTPKNIAAIKSYNRTVSDYNKDGANNYLDYDLSCYTKNNKEICTSKFLDNTDILTYGSGYSVDTRKSIAGCNNAKGNGTACDTSAHQ